MGDLIVSVKEVIRDCPVCKRGDKTITGRGFILDTAGSAGVCMHSLTSLMPYYVALSKGIHPEALGLSGIKEHCAYVQCLDSCQITGGGTVIFEILAERDSPRQVAC